MQELKLSLGLTPIEIFGTRTITSFVAPQLEVKINTDCFGILCDYVAELLYSACKLSPPLADEVENAISYDAETLMWVTALQVEAKIYAARSGTQFSNDASEQLSIRVLRVNTLFPDALTPIAVILEQIGRFLIVDQMFVPGYCKEFDFSYGQLIRPDNQCRAHFPCLVSQPNVGEPTNFTGPDGRRMFARIVEGSNIDFLIAQNIIDDQMTFTPQFIDNPSSFPWMGAVEFLPGSLPPTPPTIEQISDRYTELKGRVSKKLNAAFVEVDASSGKGGESQLVYRHRTDNTELFTVWSPRKVRSDALEMGAILALGHNNDGLSLSTVAASGGR